jgi:hypothetical protein
VISLVNFAATVVVLALLPGATARLARLLPRDGITSPIRSWVRRKYGEHSTQAEFVTCHWCNGVWASLLTNAWGWTLIGFSHVFPVWMCLGLALLSVPAVAYHASRMIDREDA